MTWQVKFTGRAAKQFSKLDKLIKQRIISFLENRLAAMNNPKQLGKALQGTLSEYWAYRVGDYRILTKHQDDQLLILIIPLADLLGMKDNTLTPALSACKTEKRCPQFSTDIP